MASLAKLSLAASDENEEKEFRDKWRQSDLVLSLGAQHRALPADVRLHYGLGDQDMKRNDPEDLVQV